MSEPDWLTAYLYAAELAKTDIKKLKEEVERLKEQDRSQTESHRINTTMWKDEVDSLKAEGERLEHQVNYWRIEADTDNARWLRCLEDKERLTKAGDELHAFLINYIVESRISSAYLNKLDDGWLAAKGVQS